MLAARVIGHKTALMSAPAEKNLADALLRMTTFTAFVPDRPFQ